MQYDVYRLFHKGEKLSVEKARAAAPVTGELTIATIRPGQGREPSQMATLTGSEYGGGLLPALANCTVVALNGAGEMLIAGTESIFRKPVRTPGLDEYRQQWLCKPVDPNVLRRIPPEERRDWARVVIPRSSRDEPSEH